MESKQMDVRNAAQAAPGMSATTGSDYQKQEPQVAVILPCYKVGRHILAVIEGIPPWVQRIYVVDDACPDNSGKRVQQECTDPRVQVLFNPANLGVGGAVMTGYRQAVEDGMEVLVKMDGDDQMDAAELPRLVAPILQGEADYTKGNRFYDMARLGRMPWLRIAGNAALSFMTKISSGYWDIFDPTNGYTAVHAKVVQMLPMDKISSRYFFETDMLFRLNISRAVVVDVPMDARYGDETSNLHISRVVLDFSAKHLRNTFKRIFYNYLLRDMSLASVELLLGSVLVVSGVIMGGWFWLQSAQSGLTASAGSVMLAAMQLILGLQMLLGFLAYDIASVPRRPLHRLLLGRVSKAACNTTSQDIR